MRAILALLVLAGPFGHAAGSEIYVNNAGGDDAFSGSQPRLSGERTGPVKTINKALRLAMPGDHVVIIDSGMPYRECVSVVGSRRSGIEVQPTILEGNGAVLDGSQPVPPTAWQHYKGNVFRYRPSKMESPALFLDEGTLVRVPVRHNAETPPALEPRQWCALAGCLYFGVEPTKLPQDYKLFCSTLTTGITLFHVDHLVVRNLTVRRYQVDGIAAANTARKVVLDKVVCRENGRSGVSVGGASQVELDSCQLAGNGSAQFLSLPYSEAHIFDSILANDTAPGWGDHGGKVYLGDKRIEGGRKEIKREEAPLPVPPKKPAAEAPST